MEWDDVNEQQRASGAGASEEDERDDGQEAVTLTDLQHQVDVIFSAEGLLSKRFTGYEVRCDQVLLSKKILASFKAQQHLLAEAGTGIGKSLAYLIAAALWALQEDKRVVISTNTIPLQTQLVQKDLPLVAEVMADLGLGKLRYELAKGRANYLCKRRLSRYVNKGIASEVPHFETAQMLWSQMDSSVLGDRQSFDFSVPGELWQMIAGDADDCLGSESPYFEHCFVQQSRRKLTSAHLVITNHAMFFTDLAVKMSEGTGILPSYDQVLFDEAHHLEAVFSKFFERHVALYQVDNLFKMIKTRSQTWMEEVFDEESLQEVQTFEHQIRQAMLSALDEVSQQLMSTYDHAQSQQGPFSDMEESLTVALHQPLEVPSSFRQPIASFALYLEGLKEWRATEEPAHRGMERLLAYIRSLDENFRFVTQLQGGEDWAYWGQWRVKPGEQLTQGFGDGLDLFAQPINACTILPEALFSEVPVSLLSATLSTQGAFDFIAERLGLSSYDHFIAASPFPFRENALMVVSETSPMPHEPNQAYEQFLVAGLQRVLRVTEGHTLVLFTSYQQMQQVAEMILPWCSERQLLLLMQERGGEREKLIRRFREETRAVLFGADSFWEGIDLPGTLLQCVVLTKIPFANPKEPVTAARMSWIEHNGGNAFQQYMIPMATIKMKQGFGRLLRRMEDKGAVVMMDSRLVKKSYGRQLLASLPPARRGKLKELRHYVQAASSEKEKTPS